MKEIAFIPAVWVERSAGALPRLVCYSYPVEVEGPANQRRSDHMDSVADLIKKWK